MKKTIILNQDSLLKIKESMVGINDVSHALVCVNEARPEVDEFELGQESDNPPMGANYAHVEETIKEGYYSGANLKNIDLSEVGRVDYEFYFDEEDYNQWLEDNELIDSNESRVKYYTEEYLYDVDYYDSETYHHMASDQMLCYDDIKELFGEDMAKTILNNCMTDGKGSFETEELYYNSGYDVNNPQELNDIAMKILRHGEYYKDCRGFILTNGVVVYTESEHNEVQRIPGIDSKFQFIELGNIRVLPNSIDIGAEPTWEQEQVLRQVIASYDGEEFYLDIFSNGGEIGAQYPSADYQYIMGEINRFYSEGIRPQGGYAYESEKKEGKTIKENSNFEVNSSDIDLSSFKKKSDLAPIWQDEDTLDSRVRLRLLDIADDFWEFVNLTWVKPNGIILTGSICNFNWSQFSDIDLHLIVDFDEIDEKTEFVRDYLDAKKNEWNNEHSELTLMGFPVELYVQNVGEMPESGGIYDLEDNSWLKRPNSSDIKSIGLDKFSIKDKTAEIMTIIDDMYDTLNDTTDSHEIEQIGDDAHYLWKKVKNMRKKSLEKNGESGAGNIVYKILRRMKYLDKLWKLSTITYDRTNSIQESKKILNEYLEKEYNLPLYKYFKWAETASDKEKVENIFYNCPNFIEYYLEGVSGNYDILNEFCEKIRQNANIINDKNFINQLVNAIDELDLSENALEYLESTIDPEEQPSWMIMSLIEIVKNRWCIHFTNNANDAYNIAKNGFIKGTTNINFLAYTIGQEKNSPGYDFAFLLDDNELNFNSFGNGAVIFKTNGVLVYHEEDASCQVIFWGPSVKEIIPIEKDQNSANWLIKGLNGKIFKSGTPSELAIWVDNNFEQYRKQIVTNSQAQLYYNEEIKKYLTLLKEEVVADGSSEGNPYKKRWKAEREALKNFVANYGKLMQSKEDDKGGKLYKVYFDKTMSELIGYNYCICVQWDEQQLKPKSTVYIRALDKFTPFIRRNLQYDDRGFDNQRGTYDDMGYSRRTESRKIYVDESKLSLLTESKNSKWAQKKTRELISKDMTDWYGELVDVNDQRVIEAENDFEKYWFGEGKRQDWFIVLEPNIYTWNDGIEEAIVKEYVDYIYQHATSITKERTITMEYLQTHGVEKKSELAPEQQEELAALIKPERQKLLDFINQVRPIWDFNELKTFLDKQIEADKAAAKEAQANMEVNLNQNYYPVIGPLSFEESKEYGRYSGLDAGQDGGQICYTTSTYQRQSYSDNERNSLYLLLRKDWKEVSIEHDGSEANNGLLEPLNQYNGYDNYGLSMIFVWINPIGELRYSNTRWNHAADYAPGHGIDTALTEVDIATLMGAPFEQVFNIKRDKLTPKEKAEKILELVRLDYDNIECFDNYNLDDDVWAICTLGKWNFVDSNNNFRFLSEEWFDDALGFTTFRDGYGLGPVFVRGKGWNYIDINGEYLYKDSWLHWCDIFSNGGYALIEKSSNDSTLLIDRNGKTLTREDGFAMVEKARENWKNYVDSFYVVETDVCYHVTLFNRENIMYKNKLLSPVWYKYCGTPSGNGCFVVRNENGEYNYMNINGKLLLDNWVDHAWDFERYGNGVWKAQIRYDGNYYLIDSEGKTVG